MNLIEKHYTYDEKAEFFFKNFRLTDGRFLNEEIQKIYIVESGSFNTIKLIENNYKSKILDRKKTGFWSKITQLVNAIDKSKVNHSLPKSEKHIKRKFKLYNDKGYIALVNGLYGNNNSRKIDNSVENLLKSIKEQTEEPITYPKINDTLHNFLEKKVIVKDKRKNILFDTNDFDINKLQSISLSTIKNYVSLKDDNLQSNQLNILESEISNEFFYKFKMLNQQKRILILTKFTELISIIDE